MMSIDELSIEFEPTLPGNVPSLNKAANGAGLKLHAHAKERT